MVNNRKIIILIASLMFSVGTISIGYGFWTDSLELEGNSDIRINLTVNNDMNDPAVSQETADLIEEKSEDQPSVTDLEITTIQTDTNEATESESDVAADEISQPDTAAADERSQTDSSVDNNTTELDSEQSSD